MIFSFIKFVVYIAILGMLIGSIRTLFVEHSDRQTLFSTATSTHTLPNGFYKGSVKGNAIGWLGKKFNAKENTGINVFRGDGVTSEERYPFKTSFGVGIKDQENKVIKIDYDIPENPFWMRFVLDEIVEVKPGEYLGKLHLRLVPGYPFTLGFFELKKEVIED